MSFIEKRKMTFDEKVEIYKALGNKTRLGIFEGILSYNNKNADEKGIMCITDIASMFKYTLPTISAHIEILRKAGLVMSYKEGKKIYIVINVEKCKKICEVFNDLISVYEKKDLKFNQTNSIDSNN